MTVTKLRTFAARQFVGVCMLATLATATAGTAAGVEIIPSLGVTKSTDTNAGDAQGFWGLAIRASVLPFLKLEGGIGYRQDSFADGAVTVRQWPLTVFGLGLTAAPMVYAGGGLGWYRTTLDYRSSLPFEDSTTDKVGVHLGGGVLVPDLVETRSRLQRSVHLHAEGQ